uniref:Large ribosomal subunit protein uL29m n=1 Tax=Lynceus sp. MCZ IZ 141354 TaxID=1930659 RepID=A0A9N6ZER8_9CRUS|nr:EOG090X0DBE [Lynceus sp. MCZ IZ 141354]
MALLCRVLRPLLNSAAVNEIAQSSWVSATRWNANLYTSTQRNLQTTCLLRDQMEFFDDPKNWGAREVKCGRGWRKEELRIKSNVDLHKLWYVLLKERNMLYTMEHAAKEACELFPNPERIDKVEESMANLEEVVRERNKAYWELEVGVGAPAPRPSIEVDSNNLAEVNKVALEALAKHDDDEHYQYFRKLYNEQVKLYDRRTLNRRKNHVLGLLKRFPNMDMEALQQEYPELDIEKLKLHKKTRGHHEFNTA